MKQSITASKIILTNERRTKPRMYKNFPARVQGEDAKGEKFEEATVLDNLARSGLYLRLARDVKQDMRLSITIRLSTARMAEVPVANLMINGVVMRTEPLSDGQWGLAIAVTDHRFV